MAALCLTALAVPVAIWAQLPRAIARGSRGGRFQVPNASLHLLIQLADGIRDYQIVGEPSWAASDGFAITAKAEGNASPDWPHRDRPDGLRAGDRSRRKTQRELSWVRHSGISGPYTLDIRRAVR